MNRTYWTGVLQQRVSRRRAMAATAGVASAAALLAACGSSKKSSGSVDKSSLVSRPVDETKSLKRGGTWKSRSDLDPPSWDPMVTGPSNSGRPCYSGLFRSQDGYMGPPPGEIIGDLLESWTFSPDKLVLTGKINPNARFAPQEPVNGRAVDAKDVVFSWERFKATGTNRLDLANELNPLAPILSMTAADDQTLVIKLNEPYSTITSLLCLSVTGEMAILAKEAADPKVLDPRTTVRGSGPFYMAEYKSSVGYTFKRNPAYKLDKRDLPYVDQIDKPIVTEYAAAQAQFRTGAIYDFAAKAEDVLPLKRDIPDLALQGTGLASYGPRTFFALGAETPFKDERVRQAWVRTWDRDAWIDAMYNVSDLRKQGLSVDTKWEAGIQADTWKGWFIDPQSKEYGPNARFFQQDLAEAKKLLAAAGYANGVETEIHTPANDGALGGSATFFKAIDIMLGMVKDSGLFRWKEIITHKLASDWLPNYHTQAKFGGVGVTISGFAYVDPTTVMYRYYHPRGSRRQGTDATFEDLMNKAIREFDVEKRRALILEAQRHEGETQFFPWIGLAEGFQVYWPVLRNYGVYRYGTGLTNFSVSSGSAGDATVFLDPERPPVKRS